MEINAQKHGPKLYVALSGELDHHSADKVRIMLDTLLHDITVRELTLDLGGVTFMDSSGLAVVLNAKRCAERVGGHFSVKDVPAQAMKIFNAANLQRIISFI